MIFYKKGRSTSKLYQTLRFLKFSMSQEKNSISKLNKQKGCKISLLDLPDVVLDFILEKLSPLDLCRVAQVCTHLRNTSRSDYLWEKHVQQKWSRLLGEDAHREWHRTNIIKPENIFLQHDLSASCGTISGVWPFQNLHSYLSSYGALTNLIKNCSKMALFICLETGRFWFPAQIFQRLPMYQCCDTLASYDSRTDTFRVRFRPGCWQEFEDFVPWNRLRVPPPKTFLNGYYTSHSLSDLKPGDHIEIQKRAEKDAPYDWRFAVVAHLKSCDKDMNHCRCQYNDNLVVEFKFSTDRLMLNRNVPEESFDEIFFYGGIRKLDNEEIEKWNNILPSL